MDTGIPGLLKAAVPLSFDATSYFEIGQLNIKSINFAFKYDPVSNFDQSRLNRRSLKIDCRHDLTFSALKISFGISSNIKMKNSNM